MKLQGGLTLIRRPKRQLDLCQRKGQGGGTPVPNTTNQPPRGAHEAPTGGLLGLVHRCHCYEPPRGRNWMGGARMPRGTEWVGAFAQLHWMGGGMPPYKSGRAGEWRPKILDGRAMGPYTRWEGHGSTM